MLDERNDGGPAAPVAGLNEQGQMVMLHNGMSLRDWFAGQALPGVAQATMGAPIEALVAAMKKTGMADGSTAEDFAANQAYRLADAMLKARKAR